MFVAAGTARGSHVNTVGSSSRLDLGKRMVTVLFASRLVKQNFHGLHFFSQIRTRLGSAANVACPHELLVLQTDTCRGKSLSITYAVFDFFC